MKTISSDFVKKIYMERLIAILFVWALLNFLPGCKKEGFQEPDNSSALQLSKNMKQVDKWEVATGLVSPIGLVAVPDNSNRLAVIDQIGKVWMIDGMGNTNPVPFMDIASRMVTLNSFYDERGLLGLAFHPDYQNNGRFFVYYNAPPRAGGPRPGSNWNNLSKIVEYKVSANPNVADISNEKVILQVDDPQSNHNGGTIAFGADGYLYIAIGDGGGANDVGAGHVTDWYTANAGGNGQDLDSNLFGNILRIDINNGNPYAIPADNPFVNKAGLDETYAYGFRNPFRFSFDMSGSRQLYAGDAGQLMIEEVDVVKKGGNYGWNVKEGTQCFNAAASLQPFPTCPDVDPLGNKLEDPVIQFNNWNNPAGGKATTVIGGNVYRGNSIPGYQGKYIFGTFSQTQTTANGELFIANPAGPGLWPFQEISLKSSPNDVGYYLKGFGQDLRGEIYLTTSSILGPSGTSGKIFKLVLAE